MDDFPPVSTLPALLEGLTRIEERLSRMERRLDQLDHIDQLPNIVAVLVDTLDQHANQLQARGVNLEQRAQTALALLERITDPKTAEALAHAEQSAPQRVGMFGLLRALSDPEVQYALGFAIALARELGRSWTPKAPNTTALALPVSLERKQST